MDKKLIILFKGLEESIESDHGEKYTEEGAVDPVEADNEEEKLQVKTIYSYIYLDFIHLTIFIPVGGRRRRQQEESILHSQILHLQHLA